MTILIIEDEQPAAKRLAQLLATHLPEGRILDVLDSVESAVRWFRHFPAPDLVFMDIQLADGLSFDIFSEVEVRAPVIFTTAFDAYSLRAFKVNSVDYLLKPIDPEELAQALEKFGKFYQKQEAYDRTALEKMLQSVLQKPAYRDRFLVKSGQQLTSVKVEDIAYFFSEDGLSFAQCRNGKKHLVEMTLDQLEGLLDPLAFFRINRKLITRADVIQKITPWFNSRLKLELQPPAADEVLVSRERVGDFKKWLGG